MPKYTIVETEKFVAQTISSDMLGANFVSTFDFEFTENSQGVDLLDSIGVTLLRYPGGAVTENEFTQAAFLTGNWDETETVFRGSERQLTPMSEFFETAGAIGADVQLVIPMRVAFEESAGQALAAGTFGTRDAIRFEYFDHVDRYLNEAMRLAEQYGVKISHFELGNEFWGSGEMSAGEYGLLAGTLTNYLAEAFPNVEIFVQNVGSANFFTPSSDTDIYLEPIENDDYRIHAAANYEGSPPESWLSGTIPAAGNSKTINQVLAGTFTTVPGAVEYLDGLINHIYFSDGFIGVDGERDFGLRNSFNHFVDALGTSKELEYMISEWSPRRNNADGLQYAHSVIETFFELASNGVDVATFWPLTFGNPNIQERTLIDSVENDLTFGGVAFKWLTSTIGTVPLFDFEVDSQLDIHGYGDSHGLVMYVAERSGSNSNSQVDIDLAHFAVQGDYFFSVTRLLSADGSHDERRADPLISYNPGRMTSGETITFSLDPWELLKIEMQQVTDGDDHIVGSAGQDSMYGLEGNDILQGFAGADSLSGQLGDDTIEGGEGDDFIKGGWGNDALAGGAGDDWLRGQQSNDTIQGGDGDDRLDGGVGDDHIKGGQGNDTVIIHDNLRTTTGANNIRVEHAPEGIVLISGDGRDILEYDLEFVRFDDGTITLQELVTLGSTNNMQGTQLDENIQGSAYSDIINALGGNDWIVPGGGSDIVDAGEGFDMVSFIDLLETPGRTNFDYRISVDLEAGVAVNHEGTEQITLNNVERVTGTIFADFIRGDEGANQLRGAGGYDWFIATTGADTIDGGTGQDMISFIGWENSAPNVVSNPFSSFPPTTTQATGVFLDLQNPNNNSNLAAGLELTSVERVTGSSRQDVFYGDAGQNDFRGLGDFDWFVGSDGGRDRYYGGDGIDTVTYFLAPDAVTVSLRDGAVVGGLETGYGSTGWAEDDLYFEIENIVGSEFSDALTGNSKRNQINGLGGDDFIFGFEGIDYLKGGKGDDTLNGGADSDYALFEGSISDSKITRTSSNEITVIGSDGTDLLIDIEYLLFDDGEIAIWDLAL
ncbi:MAG: calcium-binding protein [Paracoccaceae bacterium]